MKTLTFLAGLMLIALLAVACTPGVPVAIATTQPIATILVDQESTISALETLVAITPSATATVTVMPTQIPTATVVASQTPTATVAPTLMPTPTPTFTPTPGLIPCNLAQFVADVTIPDGTLIAAGSTFTKTWRLRNVGTCTWSPDYKIVYVSGYQLGDPANTRLGASIAPGQTIDISLALTAPNTSGTYKGSYKLADASGNLFGTGASGNGAFYVVIQQGALPTSTSGTSGTAQVSLSTTRVQAGDEVTVYVSGFPANSDIDYRLGRLGNGTSVVYDGSVGSDGTTSKTVTIPPNAAVGENWVVQVITTSLADVLTVSSRSIYVASTLNTGNAQVTLSTTQAHPGDEVTVYVSGFPANAEIDLRVGKQDNNYSVVYDGIIDSNGTTIRTITIPTGAVNGEYWVVLVTTTSLQNVVTVTSHTIYITN